MVVVVAGFSLVVVVVKSALVVVDILVDRDTVELLSAQQCSQIMQCIGTQQVKLSVQHCCFHTSTSLVLVLLTFKQHKLNTMPSEDLKLNASLPRRSTGIPVITLLTSTLRTNQGTSSYC